LRNTGLRIIISTISLSLLSGCFANGKNAAIEKRKERLAAQSATAPKPGTISVVGGGRYAQDWTFMGFETFNWVIRNELRVTGSNLNPAAEQAVLASLAAQRMDLGGSNYAMGVTPNLRAEPSKFKILVELLNEACLLGVLDPVVRARIFPVAYNTQNWASEESFDAIYMKMLARYPEMGEKEILRHLTTDLKAAGSSFDIQAAAVCTTVLSSVEFQHGY
jgi:hypothetical protein